MTGRGDDWEQIDEWTRRVGRWMLVGLPTWIVLLAAFNENVSGIPLEVGFVAASLLALIVTAVDDVRRKQPGRRGIGPLGRGGFIWAAVFTVLALMVSAGNRSGAAVLLVPVLGATVVTAFIEFARRALRGRR